MGFIDIFIIIGYLYGFSINFPVFSQFEHIFSRLNLNNMHFLGSKGAPKFHSCQVCPVAWIEAGYESNSKHFKK